MKKKIFYIALAITVLFGFGAVSSEVTLVESGSPRAAIVLEAQPTRAAQMGALELNHHIKLITGSELPVVHGEAEAKQNTMPLKIYIGGTSSKDLKPSEKLSIKFTPGVIRLDGYDSTDRGTVDYTDRRTFPPAGLGQYFTPLLAVYEFLENHCDLRFYGFFDTDTVYTPRQTLSVAVRDVETEPFCPAFREARAEMMTPEMNPGKHEIYLWRLRLRMNASYGRTNHNVQSIYFAHWAEAKQANLKGAFKGRRPELFAQNPNELGVNDPRLMAAYPDATTIPHQLCYSHPDTIKHFADETVIFLKGGIVPGGFCGNGRMHTYPGIPFYYPIQGLDYKQGFCRCEKCAPRIQTEKDIPDYTFQFVSDVAREAAKQDPRAGVSIGAYDVTYAYPEKTKLADNLTVQICPVIFSWWHPIVRERQHGMYKRWIEAEGSRRPISIWGYVYAGGAWDAKHHYGNYKPFVDVWYWNAAKIIKEFVDDNVAGLYFETDVTYMLPAAYIAMRLAWDGNADPAPLLEEYFERYYGAAGTAMKAFFRKCEALYWDSKKYSSFLSPEQNRDGIASPRGQRGNYWTTGLIDQNADFAHITDKDMEELESLLQQAEAVAGEPEKPRIARVRKGIWATAQQGYRDYQKLQIIKKTPLRILTPMIVEGESAAGDPDKIDWKKVQEGTSWITIMGEASGSSCTVRTAVDAEYFYCELRDPEGQGDLSTPGRKRWDDDFEIFFKPVGKISYQLCVFPNEPAWSLVYENGTKKQITLQEKVLSQDASDGSWVVRLAIPRQQIAMNNSSEYRINFARVRAGKIAIWNPTFTFPLPQGANRGGVFCLNPGGEMGGSQVLIQPGLQNWTATYGKDCALDTAVKKVSDASIRLKNNSRVAQSITMEPGMAYRVSFYIRGENITGRGARMIIQSDMRWMRLTANLKNELETGTFDWKKSETDIIIRPHESGNVQISLDLTGPGTAWFDGLKIEKVTD